MVKMPRCSVAPLLALCAALCAAPCRAAAPSPSPAFAAYKRLRRALPWDRGCQYYDTPPSDAVWRQRHVRDRHPFVLRGGLGLFVGPGGGAHARNWTDWTDVGFVERHAIGHVELRPYLLSTQRARRRSVRLATHHPIDAATSSTEQQHEAAAADDDDAPPGLPLLRLPHWDAEAEPFSAGEVVALMRATRQRGSYAAAVLGSPTRAAPTQGMAFLPGLGLGGDGGGGGGGGSSASPPSLAPPRALARAIGPLNRVSIWLRSLYDGRPTESGTHYDEDDNFMLQLRGTKKVVMFPPMDAHLLYTERMRSAVEQHPRYTHHAPHFYNASHPHSKGVPGGLSLRAWLATVAGAEGAAMRRSMNPGHEKSVDNYSPVELSEGSGPDLGRYPAFRRARPQVCKLAPGDVLWMPGMVWHNVFSFAPPGAESDGLNFMVNLWHESADERGTEVRRAVQGVLSSLHDAQAKKKKREKKKEKKK